MAGELLTIAGYDPSGGAGVILDLRVFARFGFEGFGVLTSVTAQNAARVIKTFPLPAGLIRSQYRALAGNNRFGGIKVGMIGSLEGARTIARILSANAAVPRVVDPVFRSSSGRPLIEKEASARLLELLRGRAELITPNLDEAAALGGEPVRTVADMKEAARRIYERGLIPCLIKGGHLKGQAVDVLYDGQGQAVFEHARVEKNVHGTGCFLSAVILAHLAGGSPLVAACRSGIRLTGRAIRKARPVGAGRAVFPLVF
jgi:hydroxymethylpyrimidine/phosphomethylpyrimidine kinase